MRPASIDLPSIGRRYGARYEPAAGSNIRIESDDHAGVLLQDDRLIAAALRDWLMQRAMEALQPQLAAIAEHGGFQFRRMQVRRQRTRWGSCSASGTISLNVCVLFLEPAVMRYLLIHELAHTRHMNHSKRFWALVEMHEPQYRRLDRELVSGWRRVPAWVFA